MRFEESLEARAYTTIRKVEREQTSNPGFFIVLDIADVLKIKLEDLAFRRQRAELGDPERISPSAR